MKYFSLDTVVNSYVGFQDCMTNKSWGYLALLKGCKYRISVGSALEIDLDKVSNFLENIFCLKADKKKYDSCKTLNAIFSNKWGEYFNNEGKHSPNIYDVAVWAYRRKAFADNTNIEDILNLFAEEFNIPFSILQTGFNTEHRKIEFSESSYFETELREKLSKQGVDVSQNNITAQKKSVVASPGEISRGPFVQPLYAGLDITDYVIILQSDFATLYKNDITLISHKDMSLQQIFYGAPGTGKSFTINEETTGEDVVRTTFHPDSDYSTFVGAYKPTTVEETVMTVIGTKAVPVENEDGSERKETKIVYEFVEQAFLKAYIKAWLNYAQAEGIGEPKKEYLVIEEINRGNCAQIFGDLFQLLDRNASGYSDYPIQADKDMQKQLQKAFKGVSIPQAERINDMYDGKDVVGQVFSGDILLLPNNLYIWATMNTSDQSLFPIDSAFKRRWDWTYVPISDAKKGYTIKVDNAHYDWWQFLEKINHKIGETTNSEDKKLGYFFCKADDNGEISAEKFVGKVIFYLWNDVFKDYEFGDAIFNDEDGTKLTFDKFHKAEGRESVVMENKVQLFLTNLGLEPITSDPTDEEDEEGEEEMGANASIPKTAQIFNIEFPDGQKIEESNKFETYYQTLLKIGLEKVEAVAADMKYKRKGSPLVSRSEYSGILEAPQYRYVERDGFYIVKGIQDSTKYTFLDHLNKSLHLGLKITYK